MLRRSEADAGSLIKFAPACDPMPGASSSSHPDSARGCQSIDDAASRISQLAGRATVTQETVSAKQPTGKAGRKRSPRHSMLAFAQVGDSSNRESRALLPRPVTLPATHRKNV